MLKNAMLFLTDPLEHYDPIGILVENLPMFPVGTHIDLELLGGYEPGLVIRGYDFTLPSGIGVSVEYSLQQDWDNYVDWLKKHRESAAHAMRQFRSLKKLCVQGEGQYYSVPYVYPHRINFDMRLKLPSEL